MKTRIYRSLRTITIIQICWIPHAHASAGQTAPEASQVFAQSTETQSDQLLSSQEEGEFSQEIYYDYQFNFDEADSKCADAVCAALEPCYEKLRGKPEYKTSLQILAVCGSLASYKKSLKDLWRANDGACASTGEVQVTRAEDPETQKPSEKSPFLQCTTGSKSFAPATVDRDGMTVYEKLK